MYLTSYFFFLKYLLFYCKQFIFIFVIIVNTLIFLYRIDKWTKGVCGPTQPTPMTYKSEMLKGILRSKLVFLWQYVSKHEGDLVAKCYFSKHKIVWEVLDGGLKKKFEINWADIVGLKANCAANGPGGLTIVLDKPPLFFKEINPQPRKHTQWRSTADFTDGEANTQRQHFLQCEQGVLDKHYEKLIQCDARLNFLSQQQDIILNFPFVSPQTSINDQNMSANTVFNIPEFYGISHMASPSALLNYPPRTVESGSLGLIHQDKSKEAQSSSSGTFFYHKNDD
ncbi:hypothetical protein HanHA89_Chr03g0089981 [Helianthus annuus]|nr:hypothetical protein HanHA89_Chr03g0089981 [Helianthus annuus]